MKVIAVLLIVAVAMQGVFAVTSKATQTKILIERINKSMEKTHLGRALKNMVTIASKLGYNYEDLFDAFDALKANLLNTKQSEDDLYSNQSSLHYSAVSLFQGDIAKYNGEIVAEQAELDDQNTKKDALNTELATKKNNLAEAESDISAAQAQLKELTDLYNAEVVEYQKAQNAIQQAVAQLETAQSNYSGANLDGFSFAQIKSQFVIFAQKISKTTSQMNARHQLFIKPVLQSMSMMQTTTDQSSIQGVIQALKDLADYFNRALVTATTQFQSSRDGFQGRINNLSQTIDLLSNVVIPDLEGRISAFEQSIAIVEQQLQTSKDNLTVSQASLEAENAAFEKTTNRHNAIIDRVTKEYQLVVDAERIVREAQANQQ